jgi:hypothetical protein
VYYCNTIQQLSPADIVRSLEKSGKLQQALNAANQLSVSEQDKIVETVERVKKRLWQQDGDLKALRSVTDNAYIVAEALTFCKSNSNSSHDSNNNVQQQLHKLKDMNDLRSVLELGMERLSWARLATLAALGGQELVDQAKSTIRNTLVLLGTYQLMVRLMLQDEDEQQHVSSIHFLSTFLPNVDICDLANQFAEDTDIVGLILLVVRHWDVLLLNCEWMLRIPPTLPPAEYSHLIPVIQDGEFWFCYDDEAEELSEFKKLPEMVHETFGLDAVLDLNDRKVVFGLEKDAGQLTGFQNALQNAYISRIKSIQAFTGSIEYTFQFSRLAVLSLVDDDDNENDNDEISPKSNLSRAHKEIKILRDVFLTFFSSVDNDPSSAALLSLTAELSSSGGCDLPRLLSIAAEGGETWQQIAEVLNMLKPLLLMKDNTSTTFGEKSAAVEEATLSLCLERVSSLTSFGGGQVDSQKLMNCAGICAAVATLSRTTIPIHERLVKDKLAISKFVISAIKQLFRLYYYSRDTTTNVNNLMDVLWVLYESLPVKIPASLRRTSSFPFLT